MILFFYIKLLYLEYKRYKINKKYDIFISIFPDKIDNIFVCKILKPERYDFTEKIQYKTLHKEKFYSYLRTLQKGIEITENYLNELKLNKNEQKSKKK